MNTTGILRRIRRTGATLALVAVVAACGGRNGNDAPPVVAASANIGAAGGEVVVAGGSFRLTVPPGALTTATIITVTELAASDVPADLRSLNADRVYRLEPAGTRFSLPVTMTATLPVSSTGAIAVMGIESNGVREMAGAQSLRMQADARILTGQTSHFSHIVIRTIDSFTTSMRLSAREVEVGTGLVVDVILRKDEGPDTGFLESSVLFAEGPLAVTEDKPLPSGTNFESGTAKSVDGRLTGICTNVGENLFVKHSLQLKVLDAAMFLFAGGGEFFPQMDISLIEDFKCVAAGSAPATLIATGVFPAPLGLTGLDGVSIGSPPFADFATANPFAVFAGSQGAVAVDLVTRLTVANLTATGPNGAVLGTNLIGAVHATQPGASAPAARFGLSNTQLAQQNFNPPAGFGGTFLRFGQVLDVITAGGGPVSNTVAMIFPATGVNFVAFDAPTQNYAATSEFLGSGLFSGSLVSGALFTDTGPIVVATRNADGGTTSKLQAHLRQGSGVLATTLATFADPQARRMRCIASGGLQRCAISLFGGSLGLFSIDPASPMATPTVQTVTTAAGTLGLAVAARSNGNLLFVATNFTAGSVSVVETSPDLATIVANTTMPAPTGCTAPAHPAFVVDAAGPAVVVSCNTSASYWIFRP